MINRQLYILKLKSSRLKEYNYDLDVSLTDAIKLNDMVGLSDSQMLRSIRDIRKRTIKYDKLERLFTIRDFLRKSNKSNDFYKEYLKIIQMKIYKTLYVPDYITVVIENISHYNYIYKNGVTINGKVYRRFSCSAGQARNSTVVLCCDEIIDELESRLNNGRNMRQKLAPSKFNAYFGLSSSSTLLVTEPRFIVIKDFCNISTFMANYVTETDFDSDDAIEQKEVAIEMNRTDGMGLISPEMAGIWANDLGLDYIPSQFGFRQNFMKGMLCVFPIHEFCEKKNNGNYIIDTIYTDKNGNPIKADLRDYDVIITESQFKLWKGFTSIDQYIENCHKNKLDWGVTKYSPKKEKDILWMNYQFIQTLKLDKNDIEKLCDKFVKWIKGVSYENAPYMLLFLLGVNNDEESIKRFFKKKSNYWIKALIAYPELRNDRYMCQKIRSLIRKKIQDGCLGKIIVDGNFQCLVSDPYAFMQHVCGQEVTGLLKHGEFYSNYWNNKGVSVVDTMRSPLTFVSEHVVADLRNDDETNYWYHYCESGFIVNYHGHETVNWAGSDWDYDIIASTSCEQVINGVNRNEYPMYYDPPKPKPIIFTNDDLFESDKFGFGSIIGSITNKSSNAYALLPNLEKKYGKQSNEYKVTYSRLIQCCKAQGSQIDKTKIGREVKGIPSIWIKRGKKENEFYNSILLDKHPYFFKYRYDDCRRKFKKYYDNNEIVCNQKFGKPLKRVLSADNPSDEESIFIENYYNYMPLTYSDSSMNLLCRYIEDINFDIMDKINNKLEVCNIEVLKNKYISYSNEEYSKIVNIIKKIMKEYHNRKCAAIDDEEYINNDLMYIEYIIGHYDELSSNLSVVVNCLVDYFYIENEISNKDLLWNIFGYYLFRNIRMNLGVRKAMFPMPDKNGDIEYLVGLYKMKEVEIY